MDTHRLLSQTKTCICIMIFGLALSGLTAFPIESELHWLVKHHSLYPPVMTNWLQTIYAAIAATNRQYPYLGYGTDWLAFAHLMLAVLFIGPLQDPVKNVWVIEFGMIACVCIIPLAFIAGSIRQIPIFWQLIDCSFGVLGIIPLAFCHRNIKRLNSFKTNSL